MERNAFQTNEPRPVDFVADIVEFHEHFGLAYHGKPRVLPGQMDRFRFAFAEEELSEYQVHMAAAKAAVAERDDAAVAFHLEHMLDAIVDLAYVNLGTAYLHGFNIREAWRRVHQKNMQKVRAEREADSKRGSTFDVIKPKGWTPPSHIDLVEDHAHRSV